MKKLIFKSVMIFTLHCLVYPAQAQVSFTGTELLGRPTNHSVTVNVIANTALEVYFEYGQTAGTYTMQTATQTFAANTPIEMILDGLSANTKYYYRMKYRTSGTSDEFTARDEHSFRTQRPPGDSFVFTIISDSHFGQYGGQTTNEKALYALTLQNVAADNPDFHIDNGDTYAMDPSPLGTGMTETEADNAYQVQRPYLGEVCHSIPFFQVVGNHENEEGWNFDDVFTAPDQSLAKVGLKARKKYVPNPVPDDFYTGNTDPLSEAIGGDTNHEDYYAWQWGDALFVVIDPYHYSMVWPNEPGNNGYGGEGQDGEVSGTRWDWSLGIQQYLWLKSTLENSTAKYKFVFTHHVTGGATNYGRGGVLAAPYFEWGGKNADDTWGWDTYRPASEGWDVPVHKLLVNNGVQIFFHGHDHMYAYEELDGVVYIECPKPDDTYYNWTSPYTYGYDEDLYPDAIDILPNSGHIRVTVTPSQTTSEYVRSYLSGGGTNREVSSTVTVYPNGPSHNLTINVNPAEGGTTEPAIGQHSYTENTNATIKALRNVGYVFNGWTGDVADPNATTTIVSMSTDKTITANFITTDIILGDVNGDEMTNSTDALIILSCDAGINTSTFCPMNWGDVNEDGLINSTDALIILSYDVNLPINFPVGQAGYRSDVVPCIGCN